MSRNHERLPHLILETGLAALDRKDFDKVKELGRVPYVGVSVFLEQVREGFVTQGRVAYQ